MNQFKRALKMDAGRLIKKVCCFEEIYTIAYRKRNGKSLLNSSQLPFLHVPYNDNFWYADPIVTSYNNDRLTVKIYGTNLEKITVKITSKTLSTKPYITIEKPDPNLEVGKKITEVSGYEGGTAQTYRHVYKNGKLISSRKEAYSSYKKRDKVVIIGTKPVDPEPSNPDPSDPVNPTPPSDDNVVG